MDKPYWCHVCEETFLPEHSTAQNNEEFCSGACELVIFQMNVVKQCEHCWQDYCTCCSKAEKAFVYCSKECEDKDNPRSERGLQIQTDSVIRRNGEKR